MKKLMIVAAAAAMVGGAFAALPEAGATIEGENVGSMYSIAITLKTLKPTVVDTTRMTGCAFCPEQTGNTCFLFEQGTLKINGIIASCGCEDPFKYGYYWIGSGKKAQRILEPLTLTDTSDYQELPGNAIALEVARYSKTAKKAYGTLTLTNDGVLDLVGIGFGSYTDAKYKYNKNDDVYTLKTPAKVSISGSIMGTLDKSLLDAEGDFVVFPVTDACTVAIEDCADGTVLDNLPAVGTFSVKPRSVAKLNKVIPASARE